MPADKKVQDASRAAKTHIDELLDEALEETFPASDLVGRAKAEPRRRSSS